MARPKVITTEGGVEIKMQGVTPELAAKVAALVNGGDVTEEAPALIPTPATPTGDLGKEAIGTFFDKTTGSWNVAIIKYNPHTKEARVEKIVNGGDDKINAVEVFKIQAVQLGLV